jgi:hypothetical protein
MIGVGNCGNSYTWLRVGPLPGSFWTAQNFGCVLHEEGENTANLFPKSESDAILKEFIAAAHETATPH